MTRRPIRSREYKVMLQPERFAGTEDDARLAVDAFWVDVGRLLDGVDIPTEGSFDEVKAHRRIRFYDTVEGGFNGQRYIFRERREVESDERQVTLKYRHADRYVAQDRDMDARGRGDDAETKFEEDVKPPFVSVFSYSTSVVIDADRRFGSIGEVVELFPGLADELRGVDEDGELAVVSDFCARELVLVGAAVLLGKRDIEAECAMVIWHDDDDDTTPPVCVEFSFKYGDEDEDYRGTVARDAHDVLQALYTGLPEWVDPEPKTKTAFVYAT
jgi:hypothetical protein